MEVDLCGHATLASAHCLLEDGVSSPIRFATRSGVLTVSRQPDGSLSMDFPAAPAVQVDEVPGMAEALGAPVEWTGRSRGGIDFLVGLLADELTVRELNPNLEGVASLDASGVIVTAAADPGHPYAFVSRVFAPKAGIPEDPVTGSSHAVLGTVLGRAAGPHLACGHAGVGQVRPGGSRVARRPRGRQRPSGDRPGRSREVEGKPELLERRSSECLGSFQQSQTDPEDR